jgi:anthranilate phosphoribosyltransferase
MRDLIGVDAGVNADAIRRVLDGNREPYRDIVVLNAGAALVVAGIAANLPEGCEKAALAVDNGSAKQALAKLIEVSNAT